jgi:nitric oxide reductase activation protein
MDIDALVEAHTDAQQGQEMSERLFTRLDRVERNIAVMSTVDMSGSTRDWIDKAERESLLLLDEALETPGDRYAIYGLSDMTRKHCETYRIKGSEDAYGYDIKAPHRRHRGQTKRHPPFCITIDKQGQDCLPHMYGAVNYTIIDEVEQLLYEVSEIYRRLAA